MDEAREHLKAKIYMILESHVNPLEWKSENAEEIVKLIESLGYRRIDLSKLTALSDEEIRDLNYQYVGMPKTSREIDEHIKRVVSEATLAHIKKQLGGGKSNE